MKPELVNPKRLDEIAKEVAVLCENKQGSTADLLFTAAYEASCRALEELGVVRLEELNPVDSRADCPFARTDRDGCLDCFWGAIECPPYTGHQLKWEPCHHCPLLKGAILVRAKKEKP